MHLSLMRTLCPAINIFVLTDAISCYGLIAECRAEFCRSKFKY